MTVSSLLAAAAAPGMQATARTGAWVPLLVAALVLGALRHLLFPRPSLADRLTRLVGDLRDPFERRAAVIALASRVAILAVGAAAVAALGYAPQPGRYRVSRGALLNLPARFDANGFLAVARHGYTDLADAAERDRRIGFFPALPAAMRLAGEAVTLPARVLAAPRWLDNDDARTAWGGVLVVVLCFTRASALLVRLAGVRLVEGRAAGVRAALLMAAWPFAAPFSTPYAEPLFLLCAIGAVLALHEGRSWQAAAWGLAGGLTVPNGWALSLGLGATLIRPVVRGVRKDTSAAGDPPDPNRAGSQEPWLVLAAAAAPAIGTLGFSAVSWRATGDPLAWANTTAGAGLGAVSPAALLPALGMLALTPLVARTAGRDLAMFSVAFLGAAIVMSPGSIGRSTAVLFPVFLTMAAHVTRQQTWFAAAALAAVQAWLAGAFFRWMPVP